MNIYSLLDQNRGRRNWVGIWRMDGKYYSKFLGGDDGSPENDPRLKYRRLTQEPFAQRGTLWIEHRGIRKVVYYRAHYITRKNGVVNGPYWYWEAHWRDTTGRHWQHLGRNLPAECDLIEGDAPDTESGYEEE